MFLKVAKEYRAGGYVESSYLQCFQGTEAPHCLVAFGWHMTLLEVLYFEEPCKTYTNCSPVNAKSFLGPCWWSPVPLFSIPLSSGNQLLSDLCVQKDTEGPCLRYWINPYLE
jgi:hypothetical protein